MTKRLLRRIKCLRGESRNRFYDALLFMASSEMELVHPAIDNWGGGWNAKAQKRVSLLVKFRGRVLAYYLFGPGDTISNRAQDYETRADVKFFDELYQEMSEHKMIRKQVWNMVGAALDAAGRPKINSSLSQESHA